MILKMMVAIAVGTAISVVMAFLYTYRREWVERLFGGSSRGEWGRAFAALVRLKKSEIAGQGSSGNREGMGTGRSRSKQFVPEFQVELEAMLRSGDSPNSEKLIHDWQKYSDAIYKGGNSEFKFILKEWERTKSSPLSTAFFKRLMIELLDQKSAYKSISKKDLRDLTQFNRLIISIASLLLLIEDAQKGSRTLSRSLIKNQAQEKRVFLAIEYWVFLKAGSSRGPLLSQLLKDNHPVGRRLESLSYAKKVRLCYNVLTTEWSQIPDQKTLLASFVKVMDELSAEEAKFYQEREKTKTKKESKKEKQQNDKHQHKAPRPSSLSKKDEYLARLGLAGTNDFKVVRKAYKKLAMEKHPDKLMGSSPSEFELKRAHEEFLKIQEAYHYLEKHMSDAKKSA